ncbi:cation diffusion facilitator family transporter [Longimicrobium terrae]|uniref:Cation diffusion facilitator family transporter n=1 Tax=Longimicrobium terrae TaxID=1639882 RepID=A0A841H3H2_9BACT|nr:cation diffusion facilitator family transporter [Longimicrobium terrae]MBB6072456.1 cation diffusion facilitator family transporter [Longimicrobium terrae]NNC32132.1 cation diffusion facilitator family transporter [Longimicrobium terrae]
MRARDGFDPPESRERDMNRARRLEWATLAWMASIIFVMYLTMGASQAMRTAWIEDILSLVPPIAFLVASRYQGRRPTERFPYGFHRTIAIAFLCASVALAFFGVLLLFEAGTSLISREHPTIGTTVVFGRQVWLGWLMMGALLYSVVPPVILGRMKLPLAERLHDKALHADAAMNKADWMTGLAAIAGVLGIGLGWWWADALAAALISLDVLRDGWKNLTQSVRDLMDERPTEVGGSEPDPLPDRIRESLLALDWVADADVRLREEGHLLSGEAFIVPREEAGLTRRLEAAGREIQAMDWRLYDVSLVPVTSLAQDPAPDKAASSR